MRATSVRWTEAVDAFREGRYLETHAVFEELWRTSRGPERDFYQGWVFLAAALFHRDRENGRALECALSGRRRAGATGNVLPDHFLDEL